MSTLLAQARARAEGDPRRFDAAVALLLAKLPDAELESLEGAPDIGFLAHQERRKRRSGPVAGRVRLAERLLAPHDEEDLRNLVDEALFGDHPTDLLGRWLTAEFCARADAELGAAWVDPAAEADPPLVDAAVAFLEAVHTAVGVLDRSPPALPALLAAASPQDRAAALGQAMKDLMDSPARTLRNLSEGLCAQDNAVVIPVLDAALGSDASGRPRLFRRKPNPPIAPWIVVRRLLDAPPAEGVRRVLDAAGMIKGWPVTAAVAASLFSCGGVDEAAHWEALGALCEPAALADCNARWLDPPWQLDFVLPDRPSVVRGLVRIVRRTDPRLGDLRSYMEGQSAEALQHAIWRGAVSHLPSAARTWDAVSEAVAGVKQAYTKALELGAPHEELIALAVALGQLGDPLGLADLEATLGEGLTSDVAIALGAIGKPARRLVPVLKACNGPWALVVLARIAPEDPAAIHKLAECLTDPVDSNRPSAEVVEQYVEGLLTLRELRAKVLLFLEGAAVFAEAATDPIVQAAAANLLASLPDDFPIASYASHLRQAVGQVPDA